MKKLDELAHLLANPVLPKATRHWSGADVLVGSAPQPDHLRRSFYPRDREVLTEHALEVSYFFEVLRDPFYGQALIDHCSKIEFFERLATAADACLLPITVNWRRKDVSIATTQLGTLDRGACRSAEDVGLQRGRQANPRAATRVVVSEQLQRYCEAVRPCPRCHQLINWRMCKKHQMGWSSAIASREKRDY